MAETSVVKDQILEDFKKNASSPAQWDSNRPHRERIFLFDVDGTLTEARKKITPETVKFFDELRKHQRIGIVGGSDLVKQIEQIGENCLNEWDYVFSENGLVSYKEGKLINKSSLLNYLGEEKLQTFIKFVLRYIADLTIPVMRGTFIEFRSGMLNVSPIGRNCNQQEREEFEQYDKQHKIREKMVSALREKFADYKLTYSIGGQISFDVFPTGWDKTYCIQFLEKDGFKEIHFFGDKTFKGGNDYEIYEDSRTVGHSVKSPQDTIEQVKQVLAKDKS
jgi:phosphomannomutase